jgi:hypothetical protein
MNLLPQILPDLKNVALRKKIDKTIVLSAQFAHLLAQV